MQDKPKDIATAVTVPVTVLRDRLSDYLDRVRNGGARVIVERHGRPVMALVPCEDAELLRALEDKIDGEAVKRMVPTTAIPLAQAKGDGAMKHHPVARIRLVKGGYRRLWELCTKFVEDNRITCPETIHQTDHVIENAYTLIEQMCSIVGYHEEADNAEG
jgi:prevent-host-death family protein